MQFANQKPSTNEPVTLYFDTEFTGLHQNTKLLSIGICDAMGNIFYAELPYNFKEGEKDEFVKNEVLPHMVSNKEPEQYAEIDRFITHMHESKISCVYVIAESDEHLKGKLDGWLEAVSGGQPIQMCSDVSHYDFVLFCEIFGGAMSLPSNVNPSCHDINQDIAYMYDVTEREAFDMDREQLFRKLVDSETIVFKEEAKHNSLYDAVTIAVIADDVCIE